jgi:lipoprotein-anchoring transpeptidase ErfK/SrfK
MRRRRALAALACLAAVVVAAMALLTGGDSSQSARAPSASQAVRTPPAPGAAREAPPARSATKPSPAGSATKPPPAGSAIEAAPAGPGTKAPGAGSAAGVSSERESALPSGPVGARIVRRTQLRRRPGGSVVRAIGTTTGYGSERVLSVVARRGRWLGVLSDHMPNSRAAWIPASSAELVHEPYRLDVDLSARRIVVRREGRVVRTIAVAVGKPSTATPVGRFAVTDTLRVGPSSPEYGCCAVALTGRQPNLPAGWSMSDRLAIHGTPDEGEVGGAVSNGCLHARESDMRWLLRKVTLGAQVRVRA